jgi:hypothetical protein
MPIHSKRPTPFGVGLLLVSLAEMNLRRIMCVDYGRKSLEIYAASTFFRNF